MIYLRYILVIIIVIGAMAASLTGCAGPAGSQGAPGQTGADGIVINSSSVNTSGHLILTLSDGETLDTGYVVGSAGLCCSVEDISVKDLVEEISPSVAYLNVANASGGRTGTGVIISSEGYIITAYHVVSGATSITVTLNDGTNSQASYIVGEQDRDWAVIKLDYAPSGLQASKLGSSSSASVGDIVLCGGFYLDYTLNPTFTYGIISAFRTLNDGYEYIQTDAAINFGGGGGPMLNASGRLIGIIAAGEIWDNSGTPVLNMGYCLPIDELFSQIQTFTDG